MLLILTLKTTKILNLALRVLRANYNKIVGDDNKTNEMFKLLPKSKKLKNIKSKILTLINIKLIEKLIFLILGFKKTFNSLK